MPFALQALLHILLRKVYQHRANRTLPGFFFANSHIRIEGVFRRIRRVVSVRETNFQGKRRIPHKKRSTRHVRNTVRIRVCVFKQFLLPLLLFYSRQDISYYFSNPLRRKPSPFSLTLINRDAFDGAHPRSASKRARRLVASSIKTSRSTDQLARTLSP